MNSIHRQFAPYLYPFIIEYCILVVAIWYKIYENINRCSQNGSPLKSAEKEQQIQDHENDFRTSSYVYADCHSSFRGMFAGLCSLILTIVFVILMFVGVQNE